MLVNVGGVVFDEFDCARVELDVEEAGGGKEEEEVVGSFVD